MKNIMFTILFLALTNFGQSENKNAANILITETSVGEVKLGMTVGEARKILPKSYKFGEAGGSEGVVFLGIFDGDKLLLEIGNYFSEGDVSEGGKIPEVNDKQLIESITIHDSRYKTAEGVHVGMTIADAGKIFGKIKKMINYPHVGEIGEFVNQPKYLSFTFGITGDFSSAGIYEEIPDCKAKSNPFLCEVATKYNPGAFVSTISIPGQEETNEMSEYTEESSSKINLGSDNFDVRKIRSVCKDGDDVETALGIPTYVLSKKDENKEFQRIKNEKYEIPCSEKPQGAEPVSDLEAIFGDFNFDGSEDVALYEGNLGGYGTASYQVYLFSKAANKFVNNKAFTKLAQHQGMFKVNTNKQMLYVYSKDGCCIHYTEGYKVINKKPVKVYENAREGPNDRLVTTKKLINGKWKTWRRNSATPITFDKGKTNKTIPVKLTTAQPIKWLKLRAAKGQTLTVTKDLPDGDISIIDADLKNVQNNEENVYRILQEGPSLVAKLNETTDYYLEISSEKNLTFNLTITVMDESDSRTGYLITPRSVGHIELGMTIAEARKILNGYEFSRTNVPYTERDLGISVKKGGKEVFILNAGEGEVFDEIPINDKLKIVAITVLDSSYKTADGVHPGMTIASAEKRYGKIKKIERTNHTPEFPTFTNDLKGIGFIIGSRKGDAGIYGEDDFLTNRYKPDAFISSITIFKET